MIASLLRRPESQAYRSLPATGKFRNPAWFVLFGIKSRGSRAGRGSNICHFEKLGTIIPASQQRPRFFPSVRVPRKLIRHFGSTR